MLLDQAPVGGADVANAVEKVDANGAWVVEVAFTGAAMPRWTALTNAAYINQDNACAPAATMPRVDDPDRSVCRLGIVVDDEVIASPAVQGVLGGAVVISGNFDRDQADQLAAVLGGGELPAHVFQTSIERI